MDIILTSTSAPPHAHRRPSAPSRPSVTWRQADEGLWVASSADEYLGIIASSPAGYEVHDQFTRPVGRAVSWPAAAALLDRAASAPARRDTRHPGGASPMAARPTDTRPRRDRRGQRSRDRGSGSRMEEDTMASGTVKWFNAEKGFGFIAPSDGGADLFAHYSGIVATGGYRTLEENQRVEFDVTEGPKGPQATNIRAL